ncbi:hypothetical protein CGLO_05417 [Colletotrichum gloeosporioides Cg-14]|uniref:Uncharacterized protein n=1 Tax=Colletotrichum gloeosporioides (strain Cg-14) TaxID=1237896 RepID=T0LSL3_COLGC|nr:hypothetical protein CGLO_05417 [Colletotrichum gloeosporioides Cg-14]
MSLIFPTSHFAPLRRLKIQIDGLTTRCWAAREWLVDVDSRPRSGRLRCISAVLASVNAGADNAAVTLAGAGADAGIGRSSLVFHSSLLSTINSTDLDLAWLQ